MLLHCAICSSMLKLILVPEFDGSDSERYLRRSSMQMARGIGGIIDRTVDLYAPADHPDNIEELASFMRKINVLR